MNCPLKHFSRMYAAARSGGDGLNVFRHVRTLSTPDSSEFVNAACDFLYSTAVIDLRAGPLQLSGPDFGSRWYGLQILDAYMETVENIGTRTVGERVPTTAIARRGTAALLGQERILWVDSEFLYIVVRIAADPLEDLTVVHRLQDKLALDPLGGEGAGRGEFRMDPVYHALPHADDDGLTFYAHLAAVVRNVPPKPGESMMTGLLAEIGILPDQEFAVDKLPDGVRKGLLRAVPFAQSILDRKLYEVGTSINGWGLVKDIGTYGQNYIIRALVAKHGIWANVPEESLYFIARTDERGELLHGRNRYRITFPKGAAPPVSAFWSISYYDESGRLTRNPHGRYSLNSQYGRLADDDSGSLTLFFGGDAETAPLRSNWLPAHDGVFFLNLRCYNPAPSLLDLEYRVPPVVRCD